MFRSPSQAGLPGLSVMLDDIPASYPQIARHLGITTRTLKRYVEAEQAPRSVMLALFWETRWGRATANTEAANFGTLHYQLSQARERQVEDLRRQVKVLELELARAGGGAANGPIYRLG